MNEPMECPNCSEIKLERCDNGMYKCDNCHCEVQFTGNYEKDDGQ